MKHCSCFKEFEGLRTTENTQKEVRRVQLTALYDKAKECLTIDGFAFPREKAAEDETLQQTEHRLMNELMDKCANDLVQKAIDKQEFIYKVEVDHPIFRFHERVRVDEVKVRILNFFPSYNFEIFLTFKSIPAGTLCVLTSIQRYMDVIWTLCTS